MIRSSIYYDWNYGGWILRFRGRQCPRVFNTRDEAKRVLVVSNWLGFIAV
jgi:hypothetical protein